MNNRRTLAFATLPRGRLARGIGGLWAGMGRECHSIGASRGPKMVVGLSVLIKSLTRICHLTVGHEWVFLSFKFFFGHWATVAGPPGHRRDHLGRQRRPHPPPDPAPRRGAPPESDRGNDTPSTSSFTGGDPATATFAHRNAAAGFDGQAFGTMFLREPRSPKNNRNRTTEGGGPTRRSAAA